jgi:hypothetical protein
MEIEQLRARNISPATASPEEAQPTIWAAKWDMWWWQVAAVGWTLVIIDVVINLERSISTGSWELKLAVAAPCFMGAFAAFDVWKARRNKQIENRLSGVILMSILALLWFTYYAMVELRHFPR